MVAQSRNWDIFISYATEDIADARWMRAGLARHGWRCFIAGDDLHHEVGSAQWSNGVDRILDQALVVVLLVTPEALTSRWVEYEWRSIHDDILRNQPGMLIPICVRGPDPDHLPRALRRYQAVDCRELRTRDARLEQIVQQMQGYL